MKPISMPMGQRELADTLAQFWHPVCRVEDLPEGRPLAVVLLERELAGA